eukprot:scaffold6012_cov106-Isochrysis_galbana.AAC.10
MSSLTPRPIPRPTPCTAFALSPHPHPTPSPRRSPGALRAERLRRRHLGSAPGGAACPSGWLPRRLLLHPRQPAGRSGTAGGCGRIDAMGPAAGEAAAGGICIPHRPAV